MEESAQRAPLFGKKKGQLGKYLRLSQLQKTSTVSKAMKKATAQQLKQRRDQLLVLIQELNEKKYHYVPLLMEADFFDAYDLRKHFGSKSYLNAIARANVQRNTYSLERLLPYLYIDVFVEFGHIAYVDWQHHRNTSKSINLLLKLRERGDQSLSLLNFLFSLSKEPLVSFQEIKPYLYVRYLGSKYQIVQLLVHFIDQKYSTQAQKLKFIRENIKDAKIASVVEQYIVLSGTPELYNIRQQILDTPQQVQW